MKPDSNSGALRTVVVFCLAGLYLVLAVGVTLLGSGVYRAVASTADENYTQRTALSYVANQVRRGSSAPVAVGQFEGLSALRLSEAGDDGSVYVTYIYCYDGQLRELYTELGSGLTAADGIALMELDSLGFQGEGNVLTIVANGHAVSLLPRVGLEEVGEL